MKFIEGLMYSVAVGSETERKATLMQMADIYIINRENVDWLITKSGIPFDFDMVVIDELSSFFKKVFLYILVGVAIGAVIHNWIPEGWVETILGNNNPFGVVLATLVGIPMYADIFGTIPIAEALLAKGALLGAILSFMMAVTTLSLPSLIMLKKAIKSKLLGTFIVICTVGIILVGYAFNAIVYLLRMPAIKCQG